MTNKKTPVLFVTDWGPMPAMQEDEYTRALNKVGSSIKPTAIVIMSGHWESKDILITSGDNNEIIYDYYGFPAQSYKIKYPYKGDSTLAKNIHDLLAKSKIKSELNSSRGIDHGAWVPLYRLYPDAKIPIVQISVPNIQPEKIFEIGKALTPLREQNVLIIAAGSIIHNLSLALRNDKNTAPESWAINFGDWVQDKIENKSYEELFKYEHKAVNAKKSCTNTRSLQSIILCTWRI